MMMNLSSGVSFIGEAFLTVYFFREVQNKSRIDAGSAVLLILAVVTRSVLYMSGVPFLSPEPIENIGLSEQLVRMALRFISTLLFLLSFKENTVKSTIYWSAFHTVLHNAFTCARTCVFVVVGAGALSEEPLAMAVVVLIVETGVYLVVGRTISIGAIDKVGVMRVMELVINTVLNLIIKWALTAPQYASDHNVIILAVVADFGLAFSLIALERNQQLREQQVQLAVETTELKYEVSNALRAQRSDQNLKRLYHDMKNHLLAIQSMAGDKKELNDYLGELLPQLDDYGNRLNTGSAIIDALLGDKRERAMGFGVRLHVQLDLTSLSFMNSAELVSIFGNAVDNAVEAARECSDPDERCVYIKSRRVRDMFFLSFENHYAGERSRQAGRFRTGKADKEFHGIGLGSIEKAVRKYSGEVHAEHDNEKRLFTLNIMLPLPEQSE